MSDEYGPYVYRFNRKTGQRTNVFQLPDSFAVAPSGIDNPNQFFVFAIDARDLPTYVPQHFAKKNCD